MRGPERWEKAGQHENSSHGEEAAFHCEAHSKGGRAESIAGHPAAESVAMSVPRPAQAANEKNAARQPYASASAKPGDLHPPMSLDGFGRLLDVRVWGFAWRGRLACEYVKTRAGRPRHARWPRLGRD